MRSSFAILLGLSGVLLFGQTWKWTPLAAMPTARAGVRTAVAGGKVFVLGGFLFGEPRGPQGNRELDHPIDNVEVYDPANDSWKAAAPLPATGSLGVGVAGEILYAVVGRALFAYDDARDRWTPKQELPLALADFGAATAKGRLYVIGGAPDGDTRSGVVLEYDPVAGRWARRADMPTHRHALTVLALKDKIYALGGVPGGMGKTPAVEEYDPAADRWTAKAPLPDAVAYASAVALGDKIYVFGGGARPGALVQVYDSVANAWTTIPDAFPTAMASAVAEVKGRAYRVGGWTLGRPPRLLTETLACDLL
jgi:N-acetylneuraminic acid mutarotase